MKTPKLVGILMILVFTACQKGSEYLDQSGLENTNPTLTLRTVTTPGSFTVSASGILSFPTVSDFHQTVEYICNDTSDAHLISFRSSFGIKTLNKQAAIIIDSVDNYIYYPSKVSTYWANHTNFVDFVIQSSDTAITYKYATWGEFLNLQNLVIIEGSLYKITKEKTIMILDGDISRLEDAEELEESDTTNGIFITPRSCACDPTGFEWKYEKTVSQNYSGNNHRITSTQTFSNMTIWKPLGPNHVKVFPLFTTKTKIHIQKKGILWFCHRMHFNWNAQVWVTHNLQLPTGCPNCSSANLWYESVGWNNQYECDFSRQGAYRYISYVAARSGEMPGSYCLAVKIFSQNAATTDNPNMTNGWYFYPYPTFDCSSYYENECSNFNWLYPL